MLRIVLVSFWFVLVEIILYLSFFVSSSLFCFAGSGEVSRGTALGHRAVGDEGGGEKLRGSGLQASGVGSQRSPSHHRGLGRHGEENPW